MFLDMIPKQRLALYITIIGLLPIFFVGVHHVAETRALGASRARIAATHEMLVLQKDKQELNRTVRQEYVGSDHFYVSIQDGVDAFQAEGQEQKDVEPPEPQEPA